MLKDLLNVLFPVVVASVTHPLYDAIQKSVGVIQKLPAPVTRVLVGLSATGIYALGAKGLQLTGSDALSITQNDVGVLASAGMAYLFKLTQKVS